MSEAPTLVFVGGTGRSGTHVVAELLGRHPGLHAIPIECRFHCNPKGLADVVTGKASAEEFVRKLRRYWWHRVRVGPRALVRARWRAREDGKVRGLHKILDRDRFEDAVRRFERTCESDVVQASRDLFLGLLKPLAAEAGKPGLVEMSCFTITSAPGLARIFPEARFVHSVRDGRDSGSSKVSKRQKGHHPTDVLEGIAWWEQRLALAEQGVRGMPRDAALHVAGLDALVWGDRESSYEALLRAVGLDDDPAMRAFFEGEMNASNANRERWRDALSAEAQQEVLTRYEQALDRIEAERYHCAEVLRRSYELSSSARA